MIAFIPVSCPKAIMIFAYTTDLLARGLVKKSSQTNFLRFVAPSGTSVSRAWCMMKNSFRSSGFSSPRIRFQTANASSDFPLCISIRGDSGMKTIPVSISVLNTKDDPNMYLQDPDGTLTKIAATT